MILQNFSISNGGMFNYKSRLSLIPIHQNSKVTALTESLTQQLNSEKIRQNWKNKIQKGTTVGSENVGLSKSRSWKSVQEREAIFNFESHFFQRTSSGSNKLPVNLTLSFFFLDKFLSNLFIFGRFPKKFRVLSFSLFSEFVYFWTFPGKIQSFQFSKLLGFSRKNSEFSVLQFW